MLLRYAMFACAMRAFMMPAFAAPRCFAIILLICLIRFAAGVDVSARR